MPTSFVAQLDTYLAGDPGPGVAVGHRTDTPPRIAFVFSGQGPQWHAMGRELLACEPVFRAVIEACDRLLQPLSGWSLVQVLAASESESRMDDTEVAQPALFALQAALVALWRSWGVSPDAVVGHSVGEVAALHAAGVLGLEDAVRVVWHRARLMQQATGFGGMAQVSLDEAEAIEMLRPFGDRLSVAAVNAPHSVVLSGETDALAHALAMLEARGVAQRRLPVQYAFHSAQMAPFEARLNDALHALPMAAPARAVYSTVTGRLAADEIASPAYFGRNVRSAVRFADAIDAMCCDGIGLFVEIGPHPVLAAAISESAAQAGAAAIVLASLRRGRPERETLLQAVASLHVHGRSPQWAAVQGDGQVQSLPPYAWQRRRHWLPPRAIVSSAGIAHAGIERTDGHPLLGRRVVAADGSLQLWQGSAGGARDWIFEHRIFDRAVMPAAAVMELMAAAALALGTGLQLAEFEMERPLFLPDEGSGDVQWQTVARVGEDGRTRLAFFAAARDEAAGWQRLAQATVVQAGDALPVIDARAAAHAVESAHLYSAFDAQGAQFGECFRGLHQIACTAAHAGAARAQVTLHASLEDDAMGYLLHPVLLDAALQLCSVAAADDEPQPSCLWLPVAADRIVLRQSVPGPLFAQAVVRERTGRSLCADLRLDDAGGRLVAAIEGMRFALGDRDAFAVQEGRDPWLYEVAWAAPPAGAAREPAPPGHWLLLIDEAGVGAALADALVAHGHRCTAVTAREIDPLQPQHFERLFTDIPALSGVVHLWGVDATGHDEAALHAADERCVASVLHLVQALAAANAHAPLWLVGRAVQTASGHEPVTALQPQAAGLWGLGGVIAAEHPELSVRRLDLDARQDARDAARDLLRELLEGSARDLALRANARLAPRLQPLTVSAQDRAPRQLVVQRPGTLDGLALIPLAQRPVAAHEVRLRVLAAGVNFRDLMLALGLYPGDGIPLGAECVGEVVEAGAEARALRVGDRVFGYVPGSFATEAVVPAAFVAPVPAALSDDEAAALPIAFLTAAYGLHHLSGLQRGERVLIHAAAGGVGLAAVQLAQRVGAEIFATAGSNAKRELLRNLGVPHVMDSRTLAFADQVLAATHGEGVHVVLNSLAGEFIDASFRALGQGGRFLELGKRGIRTPQEAARLRPDVAYHAYDLGSEAHANHGLLVPLFDDLLRGLREGTLRPLPIKHFAWTDAADALRYMAQARHIGKLVLRMPAADESLVRREATYWITGGAGALGRETARWLAQRGARHLVLSGRHEPSAAAQAVIDALREMGATVRFVRADAGDPAQMRGVLDQIDREMPPLAGVVHAAGTLADGMLVRQRWPLAQQVLQAKAHGAWILHELTRDRPLDFFVLYSAAANLLGAAGQGAYPAANAHLDTLSQYRRRLGLPALSVAWGAWAGAGMAADAAASGHDQWARRGLRPITPEAGFARLEALLRQGSTCAMVLPVDWQKFFAHLPEGVDEAFFTGVAPRGRRDVAPAPAPGTRSLAARLSALPAGQRRDALQQHLRERTLQVLGLDVHTHVDPLMALKDLGVDSLTAVELRNALARSTQVKLPATLLFDHPTLDALTRHFARLLQLNSQEAAEAAGSAEATSASAEMAALSDDEAEALLLAELGGAASNEMTRR